MVNQKTIISPTSPRLSSQLQDFHLSKIDPNEWVDVVDSLVLEQDFEGAQKVRIESSKLVGTIMNGLNLDRFEATDAVFEKVEMTALRTYRVQFNRVAFADIRATGMDFAEGYFEDCLFSNVKFDEASFRMTQFKRVQFENCVLNKADFYQAKLSHVSFSNCELEQTNFDKASCQAVDFRGENLSLLRGILGLKGALISQEQLIQIAPLLAAELEFKIEENN